MTFIASQHNARATLLWQFKADIDETTSQDNAIESSFRKDYDSHKMISNMSSSCSKLESTEETRRQWRNELRLDNAEDLERKLEEYRRKMKSGRCLPHFDSDSDLEEDLED